MANSPRSISEFQSARTFQLWDYCVSHSQLLIRSPKSPGEVEEPAYNLDLMFLYVRYLGVRSTLRGIRVYEATDVEADSLAPLRGTDDGVFIIESEGKRNHIVASGLAVMRTTSDIFESSLVLHWSPVDGESERYRELYLSDYVLLRHY